MSSGIAKTTRAVAAHQSALNSVIQKIQTLKEDLFTAQSQSKTLQKNLQQTDISIGALAKNIQLTQTQLTEQKKLLAQMTQQNDQYQSQLEKQRTLLAAQIRSAYLLGNQPYLKLLLNQESPEKFSRYANYYQYINRARLQAIQSIKQLVIKINENETNIQQRTETLNQTYQQQQQQKQDLRKKELQRKQLLDETNKKIQGKNEQLNKLYEDKTQLETVIKKIAAQPVITRAPGKPFRQMRGQLQWPVVGRIIQHFNQPLAQGRLHSTGILIKAPAGQQVRAISSGKVVFADWLRGFGLLTIIKHGDNYLSLYGRNQSLYVKTGDTVQAGQMIATVGNSGGFQQNALYFEIRYKGAPSNPGLWLRKA